MLKDQTDLYGIKKTKVTRLSDAEAELICMLRRLAVWRQWGDTFTRLLAVAVGTEDSALKALYAKAHAQHGPSTTPKRRKARKAPAPSVEESPGDEVFDRSAGVMKGVNL